MQKFSELQYCRPDIQAMRSGLAQDAERLKAASSFEDTDAVLRAHDAALREFATMANLASIRNTIDTSDRFYEAEKVFFDTETPKNTPYTLAYDEALLASPFRAEIGRKYGPQLLALTEREAKRLSPVLIESTIEENRLVREYQKLLASCRVQFMGETVNLSGLRRFQQSPDRAVRKAAAAAVSDFLGANAEQLDTLYDQLVVLRNRMGQLMGYDDFTPLGYLRMGRTYEPADVARFRAQVAEELVPVCTELHRRHAARIGVPSLKIYDETYQFADGNATPEGDLAFMVSAAQRMYRELSKETGEFFDFMVQYELMDLLTKPNKRVGGYCTSLPAYQAPFIFSNFNGTSADVDVLTHEAGHAFAGRCAGAAQPLLAYASPTLEACEIHSMSMEFFTHPWMELFFGKNADKYRYSHLLESLTFIPYGVCVDEFQHIVYANPALSPAERKEAWHALEAKYLPHRDYDGDAFMEAGGFWQKQQHIYARPFYYLDYALASMGAFEFYGKMQADRAAAWEDYLRLCRAGGSLPYRALLKLANLSDPFEAGGVMRAVKAGVDTLLAADDLALQNERTEERCK